MTNRVTSSASFTFAFPGMPKMKRATQPHIFVMQDAIDDDCRGCGGRNIMYETIRHVFMCVDCHEPIMLKDFWTFYISPMLNERSVDGIYET